MKKCIHIYYYVHGTTIDNENECASGWKDCELSELGIRQCHELREVIQDIQFDAVYSSDLIRAVNSAQIVFPKNKCISDNRLRECNYGTLNGAPSGQTDSMMLDCLTTPFPGGESYAVDVQNRIKSFLDSIVAYPNNAKIAVMAHRAPQLALEVLLNNKSWEQAIAEDWRHQKKWQPGWNYDLICS